MQIAGVTSKVLVARAPVPSTGNGILTFRHFHRKHFFLSSANAFFRRCPSFCIPKLGMAPNNYQTRCLAMREPGDDLSPIAPVQLESPVGQWLAQLLRTHPHLLYWVIEDHLEKLQQEKLQLEKEEFSPSLYILYKRIAEVKEKERRREVEEIIYCWVVKQFVDKEIKMITKIKATTNPNGRVEFLPNQEHKLESVHSSEALDMLQSNLCFLLAGKVKMVGPSVVFSKMSMLRLERMYAASIAYGYFLRRVDERFQLEITTKTLFDYLIWSPPNSGHGRKSKSNSLISYVMHMDNKTLETYYSIRSNEATSLIEKQTEALFGRGDGESVSIASTALILLILEGAAFGSFLWDAETYAESKYHFLDT